VAKQLTKIEYDLFRAVPSSEFMDICKSNVPRPSLSRLVEHTNKARKQLPPLSSRLFDHVVSRVCCVSNGEPSTPSTHSSDKLLGGDTDRDAEQK
jgi:hypothetical protein